MKTINALLFLAIAIIVGSCRGGGKKSMKGDEKVDSGDFISFFNTIKLPWTATDSIFLEKPADSALIDNGIFKEFIKDSTLSADFPKQAPRLFAIGKFSNPKAETYLLYRAVGNKKQVIYAAAFNAKNLFAAAMPLISSTGVPGSEKITIDPKFVFTHTRFTYAKDGAVAPVNAVYAYNNAGLFMMILTDGLPAGMDLPIIDPIDTFPSKGKWAGNYVKDKRNLLTVRDAAGAQQIKFFIHIERKTPEACDGELKAEARMVSKDSAIYTGNGDPCVLGFRFFANSVRVSESNCGNRHAMGCTFNAVYTRQKLPAVKKPDQKSRK